MRFLLRPGWLAFIALVVGFAVACYTLLAPWQFGREEQREAQERAIATADATPPVPLAELVPPGAAVTPELEWRQVTVTGTYLAEAEALVRLRTLDSKAAVEVLTPMRLDDGRVVAVDRGLAPLHGRRRGAGVPRGARRHGHGDGAAARGPARPVGSTGRARCGGRRSSTRADSAVLGATAGLDLVSGILQLPADQPGVLAPAPVGPTVADAAPFTNFSYALQWLTFGLIALVALGYFIRLEMLQRRGGGAAGPAGRSVRRALAGDDIADGRRWTRRRAGRPGGPARPLLTRLPRSAAPQRSGRPPSWPQVTGRWLSWHGEPPTERCGYDSGETGRRHTDQPGQPRRPPQVGRPRRRAVAEPRALLRAVGVHRAPAERDAERTRGRRLHRPGVRTRVRCPVPSPAPAGTRAGEPPTAGATAAVSSAHTRAGSRFATSSSRAAAQPNRAYRGERCPTIASSVFTAR